MSTLYKLQRQSKPLQPSNGAIYSKQCDSRRAFTSLKEKMEREEIKVTVDERHGIVRGVGSQQSSCTAGSAETYACGENIRRNLDSILYEAGSSDLLGREYFIVRNSLF